MIQTQQGRREWEKVVSFWMLLWCSSQSERRLETCSSDSFKSAFKLWWYLSSYLPMQCRKHLRPMSRCCCCWYIVSFLCNREEWRGGGISLNLLFPSTSPPNLCWDSKKGFCSQWDFKGQINLQVTDWENFGHC